MSKGRKAEQELAKKREMLEKREAALALREKHFSDLERKIKDIHTLHCPRCGYELQTVLAESLEVETCEACKGVWIGRAELEVLIKYTVDRRKNFLVQVFGPA
jgi:hypothetical protein